MTTDRQHVHPLALAVLDSLSRNAVADVAWVRAQSPLLTPRASRTLAAVEEAMASCVLMYSKGDCEKCSYAPYCALKAIRAAWKDTP